MQELCSCRLAELCRRRCSLAVLSRYGWMKRALLIVVSENSKESKRKDTDKEQLLVRGTKRAATGEEISTKSLENSVVLLRAAIVRAVRAELANERTGREIVGT